MVSEFELAFVTGSMLLLIRELGTGFLLSVMSTVLTFTAEFMLLNVLIGIFSKESV